ncbi:MAG: transcription termination/antitermination protein NusG, partial [Actinomycetota bacterium]|nr:transcription termination/antitermination protein NusG [Actinomycetota bacterium]
MSGTTDEFDAPEGEAAAFDESAAPTTADVIDAATAADAPEADPVEGVTTVEAVDPETGEVIDAAGAGGVAEVEVPVDPIVAFREEMSSAPGDWYVIHSYAGYENKVKANLLTRATSL